MSHERALDVPEDLLEAYRKILAVVAGKQFMAKFSNQGATMVLEKHGKSLVCLKDAKTWIADKHGFMQTLE